MLYQLAAAFKGLLSHQMDSCENVKMSTLKVRGLSNFKKRLSIFAWCRKQNANKIFLQKCIPRAIKRKNGKLNVAFL